MHAYIMQIQTTVAAIAQSFDTANSLVNTYFDRAYGQLTEGDLEGFDITPGQLASAITFFQQLQALRNGGATAPADYDATINQVRRDI
jgi:hypothetical protein